MELDIVIEISGRSSSEIEAAAKLSTAALAILANKGSCV